MRHADNANLRIGLGALVAFLGVSASGVASAQADNLPSYAADNLPSYATGEETIRGRIVSFDGSHRLALRDDRGFVDDIRLHDGTIINPTGMRLAAGQSVTIVGRANGKTFDANQIDTPYSRYPDAPYAYAYPPDGFYAPYPYGYYGPYGYPYGYAYPYRGYYGPRFDFRFGFHSRGFGIRGRV